MQCFTLSRPICRPSTLSTLSQLSIRLTAVRSAPTHRSTFAPAPARARITTMTAVQPTTTQQWTIERRTALRAVAASHILTRQLQRSIIAGEGKQQKRDSSPVTVADFAAQAYIVSVLHRAFPVDRFIAEESSDALRADESLLAKVTDAANIAAEAAGTPTLTADDVLEAIDLCGHQGGDGARTWVLDPIDGTIGYVSGRQYCIALALTAGGVPTIGVLGCPSLEYDGVRSYAASGVVFHAVAGAGAYMLREEQARNADDADAMGVRVRTSTEQDARNAVATTSVEARHSRHQVSDAVAALLQMKLPPLKMDSQAKYGALSRGDMHVFLRQPRAGYVENVWDHAAGVVVLEAAGGRITDGRGRPLDFSLGRTLDNLDGIVATSNGGGTLHDEVLAALQQALSDLDSEKE